MPASEEISFELERFEWASPDRLEVEGRWHGVRRRLARATLVVEVDGRRRRLKALPDATPGSPERWIAAFPWEGEMPRLPGAELEVGRGIVVDLPRPRRSKAGGAAPPPAEPIPATSREERDATPGREEAERLLSVPSAARAEADEAAARAAAAQAEATEQRERAEAVEAELASTDAAALRARAETAEAELEALRSRAQGELETVQARAEAAEEEQESLRARTEAAEAELEPLQARAAAAETDLEPAQARAEAAEAELTDVRTRAEAAEAELAPLQAELTALRGAEGEDVVAPNVARLREELQAAERERIELRAQLDATGERLEAVEQEGGRRSHGAAAAAADTSERTEAMPGPRTLAAGGGARRGAPGSRLDPPGAGDTDAEESGPRPRTRRPAERTARRTGTTPADSSGQPLGERISEWIGSLTGSRSPESNNGAAESDTPGSKPPPIAPRTERARAAQAAGTAVRTRRRSDRFPGPDAGPSWPLRVAAVGLLALLMVALVVIVLSLF